MTGASELLECKFTVEIMHPADQILCIFTFGDICTYFSIMMHVVVLMRLVQR